MQESRLFRILYYLLDKGHALPKNNWLYDFLMSIGDIVTIIQPKAIRQTLITKLEAARDHHKGE